MDVYLAEDLITHIRTHGGFPDARTEGTTDDDLLDHLNHHAYDLYGEVMKVHEEYFCRTERIALVSGTSKYRIPSRAMFGKLRDLRGYSSDNSYYAIPYINRENIHKYGITLSGDPRPYGFYPEGNYIVFFPPLTSAEGFVDLTYFFRPGWLVLSTDCRKIASMGPGAGQVTLESSPPASWTTSLKYDIHSGLSGAEVKNWSMACSSIVGSTMTLTAAALDGSQFGRFPVEVGDWICREETAALPGLPREMHTLLARSVILSLKEEKSPSEEYQASKVEFEQALKSIKNILVMRVEGVQERMDTSSFFLGG